MPDEVNLDGLGEFDKNFAKGGTFDKSKEVTPDFNNNDAVDISFSNYDTDAVSSYLSDNGSSENILRVTFDLTSISATPYRNARFGVLTSEDGSARSFVGVYETSSDGVISLINIPLSGQSLGALATSINEYDVAKAEVLNNRYDLSTNCLLNSPLQNGTSVWSVFFRIEDCAQVDRPPFSTLKDDIKFYYTSVEPELSQSNPIQSLGGYISPTELYDSSSLSQSISFVDTYIILSSSNLTGYSILQIGDEVITVKEWKETTAIVEERHAFGTPIRFHPAGTIVKGISKNDIFNRVFNEERKQYRCIAVRNTSLTEIARDVKVFFKISSRNVLSQMKFAIEIPKSDFHEGSASDGSVISVTDSSLSGLYDDDHFLGSPITISSGSSAGQVRIVSAYDGSIGKFTVDSEFPNKIRSGNTYVVNTSPAQIIPSGITSPKLVSNKSNTPPYLISDFQSATFSTNGFSINVGSQRDHGSDLYPNEVFYVWMERQIDDDNDEFINNRSIFSVSFNRA